MCALILFAVAQLQAVEALAGPDGVRLSDAREFGYEPEAVRALSRLAVAHADSEWIRETIRANQPEEVWRWEAEVAWRAGVWQELIFCLECPNQQKRMDHLILLRRAIGEEAYEARRMPLPTPSYRSLVVRRPTWTVVGASREGGMKQRCFQCHKPARLHKKLCKSCEQVSGVFKREQMRQEAIAMASLTRRRWL